MELFWELLITFGTPLFLIPGSIYLYRRDKRVREIGQAQNPAIEEALSMTAIRSDPDRWLPKLRGKVTMVCSMSAPRFGEESVQPYYHSFLIDTHGEALDLEESPDSIRVERNAKWLAEALDVLYEAT